MKILMVNRSDAYTLIGGDSIQLQETKKELEKSGLNIDLALGPQTVEKYMEYDIIHVFNMQNADFTYNEAKKIKKAGRIFVLSSIWWEFQNEYLENVNNYSSKFKLISKIIGKNNAIKLKKIKYASTRKKQEEILRMADIILPNSNAEIDLMVDTFKNCKREKCIPVHNGISNNIIDTDVYEIPYDIKQRGFKPGGYALQVGRIEAYKNTLYTIRACKELNIPLVLVGKEKEPEYVNRCRECAEGTEVYFAGVKKIEDIIPYYQNARLHILPSYRETPGLVNIEAGYWGCSLVTTEIGSAREYMGKYAYYCNPNDFNDIKNKIKMAWEDTYDSGLKDVIINNYTWAAAARETKRAYDIVMNKMKQSES